MTVSMSSEGYFRDRVSDVNLTGQDLLDFLQSLTADQLAVPVLLGIGSEGIVTCLEKVHIERGYIMLEQCRE
ncbi:hypothetical protein Dxin01_00156 [Deinococcus xinjiangensis]|uniref:Uncharacterized protein n=1 Tax=Deinococcus xinjiangensis TaxID=457454 RepID=A0ABP9V8D5_9DEIO